MYAYKMQQESFDHLIIKTIKYRTTKFETGAGVVYGPVYQYCFSQKIRYRPFTQFAFLKSLLDLFFMACVYVYMHVCEECYDRVATQPGKPGEPEKVREFDI